VVRIRGDSIVANNLLKSHRFSSTCDQKL